MGMSAIWPSRGVCPAFVIRGARNGHFCSRVSLETKPRRPKSVVAKEWRIVVCHFSVGIAQYLVVLTFWKTENNLIRDPNAKP